MQINNEIRPHYTPFMHRMSGECNTHRVTLMVATYAAAAFWLLKNVFPQHITFCATIVPVVVTCTLLSITTIVCIASVILNSQRREYISYIADHAKAIEKVDERLKSDRSFVVELLTKKPRLFKDLHQWHDDVQMIAENHYLFEQLEKSKKNDKEFLKQLIRVNYNDCNIFNVFREMMQDPEVFKERCLLMPGLNLANLEEYFQLTEKSASKDRYPERLFYPPKFTVTSNLTRATIELRRDGFGYPSISLEFPENEALALLAIKEHPILYAFVSPKLSQNTKIQTALQESIKLKIKEN